MVEIKCVKPLEIVNVIADYSAFVRPLIVMVRVSVPVNHFPEKGANASPSYLNVLGKRQKPCSDSGLSDLRRGICSQHKDLFI